jgi:hypothetical protein
MTMVMLPWVARSPETSSQQQTGPDNYHWTFSVSQDGVCSTQVDQYNTDAGVNLQANCSTTMVASPAQINRVYYPLLDGPPQGGDPANSVYRNQWAAAMASAFGASKHFYDMDNEIDIWGGTHADIHPNGSGYNELRDTYLTEARNLKGWDPAAVRLGPVSCCWYFYWNLPSSTDNKSNHGNDDFLPWWLNEVYWHDQIDGVQSLDVFDIHAYPEAPDDINTNSGGTTYQRASSIRVFRSWWDPIYVSESSGVNQIYATSIQPQRTISFRIPRMKAVLNTMYPLATGKFAITEWSTGFADNPNAKPPFYDFSTAIADAMGYGILGQQGVYLSTRWTAPDPSAPAYQALKLYRNYDGNDNAFGSLSVHAAHNANPNLFATFAALNGSGSLTIMVVNGDPAKAAQVSFALSNFTPASFTAYTLSQSNPASISASASPAWNSTQTFAPYTVTLLVVSGTAAAPPSEWDLNPAEIMAPAGGTAVLSPQLTSGSANVTLTSAAFDSFAGATACSGTITLTNAVIAAAQPGTITLNAGNTAGFCHFTVAAADGTSKGGWLVVGNPPATLTNNSPSSGTAGAQIALSVTLNPGNSVGTPDCGSPPCGPSFAAGASVLFTIDAGTLSGGTYGNTTKQIATVNASGIATVTLALPASSGTVVHVTAEGPYGLGHPVAPFTVTAQ